MIDEAHQSSCKHHRHPYAQDAPYRLRLIAAQRCKAYGAKACKKQPHAPFHILPQDIDYHTYSVQSAPDDKIPACTVPHTAEEHGNESVDVGKELLAAALPEVREQQHRGAEGNQDHRYYPAAGKDEGDKGKEHYPEISAERSIPVASERYVQI